MKIFMIVFVIIIAAICLLVMYLDRRPEAPEVDYQKALGLTDASRVAWPERGSPGEAAALERFKAFWSELTAASVNEMLPRVYAENVWFNDTVRTINNRGELLSYLLATAGHVESCRVEVRDIAYTDQGYYLRWEMKVVPRQGKDGELWPSIGITHVRFNAEGQVILHQDYWDSAGGLYEHFPLLGWLIRNIRARL